MLYAKTGKMNISEQIIYSKLKEERGAFVYYPALFLDSKSNPRRLSALSESRSLGEKSFTRKTHKSQNAKNIDRYAS